MPNPDRWDIVKDEIRDEVMSELKELGHNFSPKNNKLLKEKMKKIYVKYRKDFHFFDISTILHPEYLEFDNNGKKIILPKEVLNSGLSNLVKPAESHLWSKAIRLFVTKNPQYSYLTLLQVNSSHFIGLSHAEIPRGGLNSVKPNNYLALPNEIVGYSENKTIMNILLHLIIKN